MGKDLYDIGELPPLGEVPPRMHAMLVRPDRFGEPSDAIQDEVIDVPELGPRDVLVATMAAGVNFNNVWAARGVPVDVTKGQARWGEPTEFHIVGSDASGVVYAVGSDVSGVAVGDEVVVHPGQWDLDDPWVVAGQGPRTRVDLPRVGLRHLLGIHGAVHEGPGASVPAEGRPSDVGGGGGSHAHGRHRLPHALRLAARTRCSPATSSWSGAGRAGSDRSRSSWSLTRGAARSRSSRSDEKAEYCRSARRRRLHQSEGLQPLGRAAARGTRRTGRTGSAGREGVRQGDLGGGRGRRPTPGSCSSTPEQDTIPTSNFVCDRGGMIVICAGTSGYDTLIDVRYLWYLQKRYQGSHLMNDRAGGRVQRPRSRWNDQDHARRSLPLRRRSPTPTI